MAGPKRGTGEAEDVEVRFTRAPVDRLLVGCVVALSLAYLGWVLALRLWPGEPDPEARQGVHGFMAGSSQPPAGGGERSPAEAGEYGSSKLGTSRYFGGAAPRPIAEGAREVVSTELPEPSREPAPVLALPITEADRSEPAKTEVEPALGRLGLGPRVSGWLARRLERTF